MWWQRWSMAAASLNWICYKRSNTRTNQVLTARNDNGTDKLRSWKTFFHCDSFLWVSVWRTRRVLRPRCTLTWERHRSSRSSACRGRPPSAPTSVVSVKWQQHIRSEQPGRRLARCRYSDRRGWCFQVWPHTCTPNTQRQIGTSSDKAK